MNKVKIVIFVLLASLVLTSCVDQNPDVAKPRSELRIIATSPAVVSIMDKLDVDLVAISESDISDIPDRYKGLEKIGMAMNPDVELISAMDPDYVFSPVSLLSDLLPKYQSAGIEFGFLNLNNISGMYKSIDDLGKLLGREKEARELVDDYEGYMSDFVESIKGKERKRVLILMGLPGSYVVATDKSYVGSLVKMAGGVNVYSDEKEQFILINTEDMYNKDPDIIFRTSHAMPEDVMKMFEKEFSENDIWKHFRAVKTGNVYDLSNHNFGMSANFRYKDALNTLKEVLYGK